MLSGASGRDTAVNSVDEVVVTAWDVDAVMVQRHGAGVASSWSDLARIRPGSASFRSIRLDLPFSLSRLRVRCTLGVRWLGGRSRHNEVWVGDINWGNTTVAVAQPC